MSKSRIIGALSAVLFTFLAVSANATLIGRLPTTPGGMDYQAAYDTVLDITWVTNAGLSGPDTWDNQVVWASGLNYLGFNDWRLASLSVAAGLPTGTTTLTSLVDCNSATELACRDNELAYMFYINAGLKVTDPFIGTRIVDGVTLTDIQGDYWSGTVVGLSGPWSFDFNSGVQGGKGILDYGWAVRSGDVGAAVPEPPMVWLLATGLLGLLGAAGRQRLP